MTKGTVTGRFTKFTGSLTPIGEAPLLKEMDIPRAIVEVDYSALERRVMGQMLNAMRDEPASEVDPMQTAFNFY